MECYKGWTEREEVINRVRCLLGSVVRAGMAVEVYGGRAFLVATEGQMMKHEELVEEFGRYEEWIVVYADVQPGRIWSCF